MEHMGYFWWFGTIFRGRLVLVSFVKYVCLCAFFWGGDISKVFGDENLGPGWYCMLRPGWKCHSQWNIQAINGCFWFPLLGGRYHIIPQSVVYTTYNTTYILPIGRLYITYHLLRKPETAIDFLGPFPLWLVNSRLRYPPPEIRS